MAFCHALLDATGVAIAPGVDFDPIDGNRFIRLSFAVSEAQAAEALDRIEAFLATMGAAPAAPAQAAS
jgi:aspartate/methionine/tyrosine aminotransferase